jgi:hypothetical protein
MALTKESIQSILAEHGYRAVYEDKTADEPRARHAEAQSPPIETLKRRYAQVNPDFESASPDPSPPRYRGTGAIVMAEPLHGRGRRKAIVLSEDGEILGEQG